MLARPPHSGPRGRRAGPRGWSLRLLVVACAAVGLAVPVAVPTAPPARAACGPAFDDPLPDTPWPLRRLRPDLVWPITRGAGVVVAVIDSGVSNTHPALAGQVRDGLDLIASGTRGHCDESGHGTMIAGIIAARVTASSGFHGMAPNAAILPIRVLRDEQRNFDDQAPGRIAHAIRWAVDHEAKVINLSLVTERTPELDAAVRYAQERDVVLVAAAGNDGGGQGGPAPYPAAYPGVIAVAGVDEQGARVATSTTGDHVDIAAPGSNIHGPAPNGTGYVVKPEGGTSFAAAYVTGTVALLRAYRTDLDAPSVVRRVLRTADDPAGGWDREVGHGVVNPYWAVTSIAGTAEESPAATAALTVPRAAVDPLRGVRLAAVWSGFAGVVVAAGVLLGVPVLRLGRRRGWRPGRRPTGSEG